MRIFKYILLGVLIFLMITCCSVFLQTIINPNRIPSIFGYKPFVVLSGSMEEEIFKGDLAIVGEVDTDTLESGDIIAFRDEDNHVVTHRIVDIVKDGDEYTFVTKGDNNDSTDGGGVKRSDIEGKYLFRIGGFGNVVLTMQNPLMLCFVLLVIFGAGAFWIMMDKNKLSTEEREELEKLRKEKNKKGGG